MSEDAIATNESSTESTRRLLFGFATVVVGALCVVFAGGVSEILESLLPGRAQVSSRGTNYRSFPEVGEQVVRRAGAVIALVAGVFVIVDRSRWSLPAASPRVSRAAVGGIALGGAVWYGWLARPHNGFPSNARIHWVDFLLSRSDDFFYAAGRVPHEIFYDTPFLWQAVNVAWVIGMCWLLARRLELPPLASSAMISVP